MIIKRLTLCLFLRWFNSRVKGLKKYSVLWALSFLLITGCSKNEEEQKIENNPWEEETRFMEESKQLDQFVLDAARQKRKEIDEQTRQ